MFAGVSGNVVPTPPPGARCKPGFPPAAFRFLRVGGAGCGVECGDSFGSFQRFAEADPGRAPPAGAPPLAGSTTDAVEAAKILPPGRRPQDLSTALADGGEERGASSPRFLFWCCLPFRPRWDGWDGRSTDRKWPTRPASKPPRPPSPSRRRRSEQLSAEVDRGGDKQGKKTAKKAAESAAKPATAANVKWYNAASDDFTYGEKNVAVRVQSVLFGIPRFLIGNDVDRSKEQLPADRDPGPEHQRQGAAEVRNLGRPGQAKLRQADRQPRQDLRGEELWHAVGRRPICRAARSRPARRATTCCSSKCRTESK